MILDGRSDQNVQFKVRRVERPDVQLVSIFLLDVRPTRKTSHHYASPKAQQMIHRYIAVLIAFIVLTPVLATAQPATKEAEPPRTSWGDPDLGGVWDFRTITPLERPRDLADQEFLTEEEVAERERAAAERDRAADEAPARLAVAGQNVGAYNRFWMDFGTEVVESRRTSLIVDPPNGRKPPMTDAAKEAASKRPRWGQEPPPDARDDAGGPS